MKESFKRFALGVEWEATIVMKESLKNFAYGIAGIIFIAIVVTVFVYSVEWLENVISFSLGGLDKYIGVGIIVTIIASFLIYWIARFGEKIRDDLERNRLIHQ